MTSLDSKGKAKLTEEFNPYQPPQKSGVEPGPKNRPTLLDWMLAIFVGMFALFVTFFSTCFGIGTSFSTGNFEMLFPIGLLLCFLFSIGVGYSAVVNYLASVSVPSDENSPQLRSFRLGPSNRNRTKLDRLLFSCGIALLSLMLLVPAPSLLLELLGVPPHLSPEVLSITEVVGNIVAVVVSFLLGWFYWRRVSS